LFAHLHICERHGQGLACPNEHVALHDDHQEQPDTTPRETRTAANVGSAQQASGFPIGGSVLPRRTGMRRQLQADAYGMSAPLLMSATSVNSGSLA
jgi:hypothetical protein